MAQHNDLGKQGEELAKNYLRNNGYQILAQNWIYGKAEIDLIAFYQQMIIFVEVKSRSSTAYGFPEDFVDAAKQKRMVGAAYGYTTLMKHEGEVRFDIISVLFDHKMRHNIHHIEDAFWPY